MRTREDGGRLDLLERIEQMAFPINPNLSMGAKECFLWKQCYWESDQNGDKACGATVQHPKNR